MASIVFVTTEAAPKKKLAEQKINTPRKSRSLATCGNTTRAPIATTGNNVYIAWWTNKTGNDEVMFKAPTDGGNTFGNKINLSNSTDIMTTIPKPKYCKTCLKYAML
jgi:hypothetical protein